MKIKVVHKKLGREKAYGMADSDGTVYIDPRLKGKKHLEIVLHECLHILYPEDSEEAIVDKSVTLCKILWKDGYRKVDNSNKVPLQDGSK